MFCSGNRLFLLTVVPRTEFLPDNYRDWRGNNCDISANSASAIEPSPAQKKAFAVSNSDAWNGATVILIADNEPQKIHVRARVYNRLVIVYLLENLDTFREFV